MKIPQFVLDYLQLVNNDTARAELKELAKEYLYKLKALKDSLANRPVTPKATTDKKNHRSTLLEIYLHKARNIAKNSIDNKAAFEEIVWKHKIACNNSNHHPAGKR